MEEEQQGNDLSERSKSSHRAVLEKKLSIAERAVATNPSCVALQLERLRICQELWEPSLLTKEWKKLVSLQYLFLYATHLMFLYLYCLQSWTVKLLIQLWFIFFALKSGMVGSFSHGLTAKVPLQKKFNFPLWNVRMLLWAGKIVIFLLFVTSQTFKQRLCFIFCISGVPPPKQCPLVERVSIVHTELLQQLHCVEGQLCLWEVSQHA